MKYQINQVRKFLAAGVGAAAMIATELLALGDVIPADIGRWLTVIVAVATALGVYGVPNEPTPEQAEKVQADKPAGPTVNIENIHHEGEAVADPAVVERILKSYAKGPLQ